MRYALQIGGLLLACSAGFAAEQKNSTVNEAAPRPANIRPAPGTPKQPVAKGGGRQPKMGPPLANPMSPVARLYRATPDERERALEKLPPKMQEQFRTALAAFDRLPAEQKEARIQQAERFAALTPERKAEIRAQMAALNQLPPERRAAIRIALRRLFVMPEADRQKILASDNFRTRFSPDEQKIIADLSDFFLPAI